MSIVRDDIKIQENNPVLTKVSSSKLIQEKPSENIDILSENVVLSDRTMSDDLTKKEMYELQEVYNYSEASKDTINYINSKISLINKEIHQCSENPAEIEYKTLTKNIKSHLNDINTSLEKADFNGQNQIKKALSSKALSFIDTDELIIKNKQNIKKVKNIVTDIKTEVLEIYKETKENIERTSKVLENLNVKNLQIIKIDPQEAVSLNTKDIKNNAVSSINSQITSLDKNLLLAMGSFSDNK